MQPRTMTAVAATEDLPVGVTSVFAGHSADILYRAQCSLPVAATGWWLWFAAGWRPVSVIRPLLVYPSIAVSPSDLSYYVHLMLVRRHQQLTWAFCRHEFSNSRPTRSIRQRSHSTETDRMLITIWWYSFTVELWLVVYGGVLKYIQFTVLVNLSLASHG